MKKDVYIVPGTDKIHIITICDFARSQLVFTIIGTDVVSDQTMILKIINSCPDIKHTDHVVVLLYYKYSYWY